MTTIARTPPSVLLLAAGLPTPVLFHAFAAPALLGALVIVGIRRPPVPDTEPAGPTAARAPA